ncbi:MAG: LysR family transcriptional regulator [Gammaproteobacteria bacterium]|nr:LysR family transcriptional regulator [Gammaproteobacteria bacterium]
MTLEQLRVLNKIVELGTLKAAADALHKTQPALSMSVKKLEQQYDIQLLDRSTYRLKLTPKGKIFYRHAQQVLLGAEQLKIAYDPVFDFEDVSKVLLKCQQHFPSTEFQLLAGTRFTALEHIMDNKVDIAIGAWFHLFHGMADFVTQPLSEFEVVLAASPKLCNINDIKVVSQLNLYPSIALIQTNLSFDNDKLGFGSSKQQFKTKDVHTLKSMMMSGLGIGLIPYHLISRELAEGSLQLLTLSDSETSLNGEIRLIRKSEHVLGPVGQFFWDSLIAN